jgi:hypothetical protein
MRRPLPDEARRDAHIYVLYTTFSKFRKVGVGILIRNHTGDCLVACTEPLKGAVSPEIAESWALRCAVSLARDEGLTSVVFASDCLSLIQRINSSTNDRSEVGAVVGPRNCCELETII